MHISFEDLVFHHETDEPVQVIIRGLWQKADAPAGCPQDYLDDITLLSLDEAELDIDHYGGEDHIQELAAQYMEDDHE